MPLRIKSGSSQTTTVFGGGMPEKWTGLWWAAVTTGVCAAGVALVTVRRMLARDACAPAVYVAGRLANRDGVRDLQDRIVRDVGMRVTFDWTHQRMGGGAAGEEEESESEAEGWDSVLDAQRRRFARNDADAVAQADVLLVYMDDPDYPYRGTFTEIGVGYASGATIVLLDPHFASGRNSGPRTNVFYHLYDHRVSTVEEALEVLATLGPARKNAVWTWYLRRMANALSVLLESCGLVTSLSQTIPYFVLPAPYVKDPESAPLSQREVLALEDVGSSS